MRLAICIIFLFSFFCFLNPVFSQQCYPEEKKDKRLINKIKRLINKLDYYEALAILKSNKKQIAEFYVLKSEILWRMGEYFNAEDEASKALFICPDSFPNAYYFLGEIAYKRRDYVNADIYLAKALDLKISEPYYDDATLLRDKSKTLADIINNPVDFNPQLVKGISTKHDEYLPIISPDQELAFFTRRSTRENFNSIVAQSIEEFVCSEKIDGDFLVGKALSDPFNVESNEGGASITIDNKILYYTKCVRNQKGYNNCDIYYVDRIFDRWSEVKMFSGEVSSADSWESQPSVSFDGNTIIFASDRVGGYGKTDLYEIIKINDSWSEPRNLGSIINSSEYEKSPYLHTDGKTLFFASTNFPSLGGFDIFYSRKDSLGSWQRPVNIGFPINTSFDEISLFVTTDGEKAYFSSNHLDGVGGWDVYSFDLHDGAKPERVLFLKGNLFNENKLFSGAVELEIKNIKTEEVVKIKVDSGSYVSSFTLGANDDVLITIKKEGFAFNSVYIDSKDSLFKAPSSLDFELESIDEGKSFTISDIYFDNNSYEIKRSTKEILIEFAKYLEINHALIVQINGFTDNIGGVLENKLLSENRARAVMNILVSEGVLPERLSFAGFGESFPVASNTTEEGRARNRRTEFKVISR